MLEHMDAKALINFGVVLAYLCTAIGVGIYLSRYVKKEEDYFLAGRTLNMWVVAGTIMATDIAAIYLVGPAGTAYAAGVPVLLCGWTGNMIAALSALIFVPRFRRLGLTTITEVLEERYNKTIRLLPTCLWIIYYAFFTGNCYYTLAATLAPTLGMEPSSLILTAFLVVTVYCFMSGVMAVAYTDVIQTFLLIIGALILLPLSFKAVGGVSAFAEKVPADYFNFWKRESVAYSPNYKDLIMYILIGIPYWCTSQYMLQRAFSGRSVRDASRGLALAALMTGPVTFAYIMPGICGYLLYPAGTLAANDSVLARMFIDILPVGLGGLFIAALLAANNSTASGLLSSLSTLATNDIYRPLVPGKRTEHYLWVGRITTVAGAALGLFYAFKVDELGGILKANFDLMSCFEPLIFVPIAGAILWRGANSWGAALAIVAGLLFNVPLFAASLYVTDLRAEDMNAVVAPWLDYMASFTGADRTIISFPLCIAALVVGSWIRDSVHPPTAEHKARVERFFTRMRGGRFNWKSGTGRLGLAIAAISFVCFVYVNAAQATIAKPANVLMMLGSLCAFVFGCYLAVALFINDEGEVIAEREEGSIEGTFLHRFVSSGRSWAVVYLGAIVLIFLIYLLAPAPRAPVFPASQPTAISAPASDQ